MFQISPNALTCSSQVECRMSTNERLPRQQFSGFKNLLCNLFLCITKWVIMLMLQLVSQKSCLVIQLDFHIHSRAFWCSNALIKCVAINAQIDLSLCCWYAVCSGTLPDASQYHWIYSCEHNMATFLDHSLCVVQFFGISWQSLHFTQTIKKKLKMKTSSPVNSRSSVITDNTGKLTQLNKVQLLNNYKII